MNRAALLVILLAVAGCQPPSFTTGQGPLTPLVTGTEQHVSLEWQPTGSNAPVMVRGYINNQSPYSFDDIRVLVDALGPDGGILDQRLVWAPGVLGGGSRLYFEAPMEPAPAYRARIFSWQRQDRRSAWGAPEPFTLTPSPRPASAPSRDSAGARPS